METIINKKRGYMPEELNDIMGIVEKFNELDNLKIEFNNKEGSISIFYLKMDRKLIEIIIAVEKDDSLLWSINLSHPIYNGIGCNKITFKRIVEDISGIETQRFAELVNDVIDHFDEID